MVHESPGDLKNDLKNNIDQYCSPAVIQGLIFGASREISIYLTDLDAINQSCAYYISIFCHMI